MRCSIAFLATLCILCSSCEFSTSINAFVEPMYSVQGYMAFMQNDRLFYEFEEHRVASTAADIEWNSNFHSDSADSADVQIVSGDRASTDVFRVVLPEIWYHPISALGQSFVISNDVVRDVRIGRDSLVLFDRRRTIGVPYPLSYRNGNIGSVTLEVLNLPVSHYGRSITVDRYRLQIEDDTFVIVDIEPGNTVVRTVSVTSYKNDPQFKVRTCYYQRLSHVSTFVISTK